MTLHSHGQSESSHVLKKGTKNHLGFKFFDDVICERQGNFLLVQRKGEINSGKTVALSKLDSDLKIIQEVHLNSKYKDQKLTVEFVIEFSGKIMILYRCFGNSSYVNKFFTQTLDFNSMMLNDDLRVLHSFNFIITTPFGIEISNNGEFMAIYAKENKSRKALSNIHYVVFNNEVEVSLKGAFWTHRESELSKIKDVLLTDSGELHFAIKLFNLEKVKKDERDLNYKTSIFSADGAQTYKHNIDIEGFYNKSIKLSNCEKGNVWIDALSHTIESERGLSINSYKLDVRNNKRTFETSRFLKDDGLHGVFSGKNKTSRKTRNMIAYGLGAYIIKEIFTLKNNTRFVVIEEGRDGSAVSKDLFVICLNNENQIIWCSLIQKCQSSLSRYSDGSSIAHIPVTLSYLSCISGNKLHFFFTESKKNSKDSPTERVSCFNQTHFGVRGRIAQVSVDDQGNIEKNVYEGLSKYGCGMVPNSSFQVDENTALVCMYSRLSSYQFLLVKIDN